MSEGRFTTPPLAPEDDWFFEPEVPAAGDRPEPREARPGDRAPGPPRPPRRDERNRRLLVAIAACAVALAVAGVLLARALSGSDGGGETTTTTTPTTTQTTTTTTEAEPPTTTPTTTTPTITLPETTVRPGDESAGVSQVQAALIELGYLTGAADGKYGPATEQAVRDFQAASGLEEDGVAGPATLAALGAALPQG